MLRMKDGSIGDMPPSTRGSVGWALRIAFPAASARLANMAQSGSIRMSQCDLLLGSFQILAASIIGRSPATDKPDLPPAALLPACIDRLRLPDAPRSQSRRCAA